MDSREFRELFGHFATGVTVITTNVEGMLHGMTANAVCSVSLDPRLLLACIDNRAHCHRQMTLAGCFGVNVLAADQRHLSDLFARKLEPERDRLRGAPFRFGREGIPILDNSLIHFECAVHGTYAGGDHDIFVGEVLEGTLERVADPLLFFRGLYRTLASD